MSTLAADRGAAWASPRLHAAVPLLPARAPALVPALVPVLVLLLPSFASGQGAPPEVRAAAAQVLTLRGYDTEGQVTAQGSGFFFGPGRIATNYHVIAGASVVRVIGPAGDTVAAIDHAQAIDSRLDLAILPGPRGWDRGLRVETFFPDIGDRVWTYGSPRGLTGTMSDGIVSAIRERGGRTVLQISAPISPGSSGGPVLDASGRVVGVTVSSIRGGQNLNFAVPGQELARLAARGAQRVPFPIGEPRRQQQAEGNGGGEAVGERPELPERWQFLSRNVSDAELYYDRRSLRRDDDRLRIWVYTFYPEVLMAGDAGFDSSQALFELRCGAQEFRLNQYLLMRGERVIGSAGSISGGEWSAAAPESIAEDLMTLVCPDSDADATADADTIAAEEEAAGAVGDEEDEGEDEEDAGAAEPAAGEE